jgi:lipoate-protein ligase A
VSAAAPDVPPGASVPSSGLLKDVKNSTKNIRHHKEKNMENTTTTTYEQERAKVVNAYVDSFREAFKQAQSNPDLHAEDLFDLREQLKWADNSWNYADSITTAIARLAGDNDEAYWVYMGKFQNDYEEIFAQAARRFYQEQGR